MNKKIGLLSAAVVVVCFVAWKVYASSGHMHMNHGDSGHNDSETSHAGNHMTHMNEVKRWLKAELGSSYDKAVHRPQKSELLSGKSIYQKFCATCHGVHGKGDGVAAENLSKKPADFTDAAHASFYSPAGRMYIIEKGSPGTPMIGWGSVLGKQGVFNVYSYINTLKTPLKVRAKSKATVYFCPMHPEVRSDKPARCPKCGMRLRPETREPSSSGTGHDHSQHSH